MSPDDFSHFWKINNYVSPNYKFDWCITSLFLCFEWSYVVLEAFAPSYKFYHVSNHEALLGEINEFSSRVLLIYNPLHLHTHMHMRMHIHMPMCMHVYVYTHEYASASAYVHAWSCAYALIITLILLIKILIIKIIIKIKTKKTRKTHMFFYILIAALIFSQVSFLKLQGSIAHPPADEK